ncbi:MAG: hypothetical protein ISR55_08325 [Bacteroidetes bacterium]|nr:hypothetical protein [Bacteroidota bacterium]
MKKTIKILFLSITLGILFPEAYPQAYPYEIDYYPFINYQSNKFDFRGNARETFDNFFLKLDNLVLKGDQKINILHIGDSHIQADYFPGEMRKRMQTFIKDGIGSRGFLFPFKAAKTNGPPDIQVITNTEWIRCRNITKGYNCDLGIAGIQIQTHDSISNLTIEPAEGDFLDYTFNTIRIFHNLQTVYYEIGLLNYDGAVSKTYHYDQGYTEIKIKENLHRVELQFIRADTLKMPFVFYGISFENDDPGIVYSSVGVNGAETRSFNKCNLLQTQLKALDPDWLIISLGANDAYMRNFKPLLFYAHYDTLISRIREIMPHTALLLTIPGDSYRNRRYPNYNTEKLRDVVLQIAKKYDAAIWDFYRIMGGQNTVNLWYSNGLANRDKLHLTKDGYKLQGDLLFNAFLGSYDVHIQNRFVN